jgi:hypothetical protein
MVVGRSGRCGLGAPSQEYAKVLFLFALPGLKVGRVYRDEAR